MTNERTKRYTVNLTQEYYSCTMIEVDARSPEEARERAEREHQAELADNACIKTESSIVAINGKPLPDIYVSSQWQRKTADEGQ